MKPQSTTLQDLFEVPETLPKEVQDILEKYCQADTYEDLNNMLAELKPLGYTFEYYLDAIPFNLTKLPAPISREVEGFTELKLVRWAKDKYPPIDLNEQVPELLKLLASHQQQAKDIELLREALQNAKTDIYNWHNTRGGKKLTDIMGDFDLALKQTEPQVK